MVTLALATLMAVTTPPIGGHSKGRAAGGSLVGGVEMEARGKHHSFTANTRRKRSHYGTRQMVRLLKRAAATVDWAVGGPPMILGSISKQHGGKMGPHKSHQSGRDVDILFYMMAPDGRRKRARGFYDFDGQGRCLSKNCKGWSFDVQRNWWLVRTLLWSRRPQIQYIFVSNGLRNLMMGYARSRNEHPEILKRARRVLVQPGNSSPHADHFHVRIYCTNADRRGGCVDTGPRWAWVR